MANLNAAGYKAKVDFARKKYSPGSLVRLDCAAAWDQIAGVYTMLWHRQQEFEDNKFVPSAAALVYRTDAEHLLDAAINAVNLSRSASATASASWASTMAYSYVEMAKREARRAA